MVDGCILMVDANEAPCPKRDCTEKAEKRGDRREQIEDRPKLTPVR